MLLREVAVAETCQGIAAGEKRPFWLAFHAEECGAQRVVVMKDLAVSAHYMIQSLTVLRISVLGRDPKGADMSRW